MSKFCLIIYRTSFDCHQILGLSSVTEMVSFLPRGRPDSRMTIFSVILLDKAGYTATPVVCGWAGAVIEYTRSCGQEQ